MTTILHFLEVCYLKCFLSLGDIRHPKRVQQTDVAATLAIALGLPIPKDSVGSLLFPVVEGRPMREQLRFLHLNTVQLSKLLQENVPSYEKGQSTHHFRTLSELCVSTEVVLLRRLSVVCSLSGIFFHHYSLIIQTVLLFS